jgi:hypothetical protein
MLGCELVSINSGQSPVAESIQYEIFRFCKNMLFTDRFFVHHGVSSYLMALHTSIVSQLRNY